MTKFGPKKRRETNFEQNLWNILRFEKKSKFLGKFRKIIRLYLDKAPSPEKVAQKCNKMETLGLKKNFKKSGPLQITLLPIPI